MWKPDPEEEKGTGILCPMPIHRPELNFTLRPPWRLPLAAAAAALVVLSVALVSCQPKRQPPVKAPATVIKQSAAKEPMIRVRIARSADTVQLDSSSPLIIVASVGNQVGSRYSYKTPLTVGYTAGKLWIRQADGGALAWEGPNVSLRIESAPGASLRYEQAPFPGFLRLHVSADRKLDLVNHVPIEQYLPGVLARELYTSWHPEAYRAQAIAARSYALWEMSRDMNREYDLESTQASQAYIGLTGNRRAIEAVQDTRGVVLSFDGQLLAAYYSSSCGGTGQDSGLVFPKGQDLPPLKGREHGACCAAAKQYRWGPIDRDASDLLARFAAWGEANKVSIAQIKSIKSIDITAANSVGRPARFTITESTGRRHTLSAEDFRVACNYSGPGVTALAGELRLLSSHVTPQVLGSTVRFTDGRGYGHGVGLCQWGTQNLASQGYDAPSILAFYYHGAQLVRLYP